MDILTSDDERIKSSEFYRNQLILEKKQLDALQTGIEESLELYITSIADRYKDKLNANISICGATIRKVVKSYFYDVVQFKHFHGYFDREKKVNPYKKVALQVKWLVKLKPVQIIDSGNSALDEEVCSIINEAFALFWAYSFLGLPTTHKLNSRIVYNLKMRQFSVAYFAFFLESLDECKILRAKIAEIDAKK